MSGCDLPARFDLHRGGEVRVAVGAKMRIVVGTASRPNAQFAEARGHDHVSKE
jgi:hypothetical protein